MKMPRKKPVPPRGPGISKEFIIGLVAVLIGTYDLLTLYNVIAFGFVIPPIISDIMLILSGLLLWSTAFRLGRYKFHASRIF